MANKKIAFPSVFLPVAIGNILNCNITAETGPVGFVLAEPYLVVRHIHVLNIDTVAHVISLYKGLTAGSVAGSQFGWGNYSLAAQQYDDWFGEAVFLAADFLSGIADTASKVVISVDAELVFP